MTVNLSSKETGKAYKIDQHALSDRIFNLHQGDVLLDCYGFKVRYLGWGSGHMVEAVDQMESFSGKVFQAPMTAAGWIIEWHNKLLEATGFTMLHRGEGDTAEYYTNGHIVIEKIGDSWYCTRFGDILYTAGDQRRALREYSPYNYISAVTHWHARVALSKAVMWVTTYATLSEKEERTTLTDFLGNLEHGVYDTDVYGITQLEVQIGENNFEWVGFLFGSQEQLTLTVGGVVVEFECFLVEITVSGQQYYAARFFQLFEEGAWDGRLEIEEVSFGLARRRGDNIQVSQGWIQGCKQKKC